MTPRRVNFNLQIDPKILQLRPNLSRRPNQFKTTNKQSFQQISPIRFSEKLFLLLLVLNTKDLLILLAFVNQAAGLQYLAIIHKINFYTTQLFMIHGLAIH